MSDRRSRASVGRSTMELAIVEVRARSDELARLRARHEQLRRRLSLRMHALRAGDLAAATVVACEDAPAWQDDDEVAAEEEPEETGEGDIEP